MLARESDLSEPLSCDLVCLLFVKLAEEALNCEHAIWHTFQQPWISQCCDLHGMNVFITLEVSLQVVHNLVRRKLIDIVKANIDLLSALLNTKRYPIFW